jgi:hypothetical protein
VAEPQKNPQKTSHSFQQWCPVAICLLFVKPIYPLNLVTAQDVVMHFYYTQLKKHEGAREFIKKIKRRRL